MNIIVYPDTLKENLNVNERQFINIINYSEQFNFLCIKDTEIISLEQIVNELKSNNINSITILLDNYGVFIHSNNSIDL